MLERLRQWWSPEARRKRQVLRRLAWEEAEELRELSSNAPSPTDALTSGVERPPEVDGEIRRGEGPPPD